MEAIRLEGTLIRLRPLTLKERPRFFGWATRSDATQFWYGERSGDDIPSYVIFKLEWPDYYFTEDHPDKGRSFAIEYQGEAIGQVNYNQIHHSDRSAELDILIAKQQYQGLGYGTEAIKLLTHYLFTVLQVRRCRIEVVSTNPRAKRAYAKAGYLHTYSYEREGIEWHVMEMTPDLWPGISPAAPTNQLDLR
jgi:RimJ/RimL family protein N-acetyltransferase